MKTKIIPNKNVLCLVTFIVLIIAGFGFLKVEKASAADCRCLSTRPVYDQHFDLPTEAECRQKCLSEFSALALDRTRNPNFTGVTGTSIFFNGADASRATDVAATFNSNIAAINPIMGREDNSDSCSISDWLSMDFLKCFLLVVLTFVGYILSGAATLFNWIVRPDSLTAVISNPVIYEIWALVRDTLNIAFILVLLFSAFATIFQVERFSWRKVLLTLVIMALLVNFSFPIARFIIDFSNVLMYYFLNGLQFGQMETATGIVPITPTNLFASFSQGSQLQKILFPTSISADTSHLIAAVIFSFIFAITLLIIAVLLVVRTVALAVLIIFSPLAFVGTIVPFLSKQASSWWDSLFRYSFFGPIMVFMLYVASRMMIAIKAQGGNFDKLAGNQSVDPGIVAAMAFYSIPIAILWIGIGVAQKMSIYGAGAVVGRGKKFMGWAGRNLGGVRPLASWGFKKTGIPEGFKQSWNKNITQRFDRAQKNREAKWAGRLGDKSAGERNMKNRAAQYEKDNESIADLKKWAAKGDAAAAYTLANKGKIDQRTFSEAMNSIKDTRMKESLLDKTEDTRMDVTLKYKLEADIKKVATDPTKKGWTNIGDTAKTEYGNLTADGWSKQKNLTEQFKVDPINNPNAAAIEAGAKTAFHTLLNPLAQTEAIKRMNGVNSAAIA